MLRAFFIIATLEDKSETPIVAPGETITAGAEKVSKLTMKEALHKQTPASSQKMHVWY